MNEWREEQSGFLHQIQAHQQANENYLIQGSKLLELANKAHSLYLQQSSHQKARLLQNVHRTGFASSVFSQDSLPPAERLSLRTMSKSDLCHP
jgi:hypothetical protein